MFLYNSYGSRFELLDLFLFVLSDIVKIRHRSNHMLEFQDFHHWNANTYYFTTMCYYRTNEKIIRVISPAFKVIESLTGYDSPPVPSLAIFSFL